jgi:hypothetical protein
MSIYTVTGYTKTGIYSDEVDAPTAGCAMALGERRIIHTMRPPSPILRWTVRGEDGEVILSTRVNLTRRAP